MLVRTTRAASLFTLHVFFYVGLFAFVVMAHAALTWALRSAGVPAGWAIGVAGAAVLALVLALKALFDRGMDRRILAREARRLKLGLPEGPCCVVWRGAGGDASIPWEPVGGLRVRYPTLARRLGVEGLALVAFKVDSEGRAFDVTPIDVWPSAVFFRAARQALEEARFSLRAGQTARNEAVHQMPFVFRIEGAARVRDSGMRAKPHSGGAKRARARFAAAGPD